jgi:diacylglycerol O-acyltransferase / wax synthase
MRSHLSPLDATLLEIEEADDFVHMQVGWAIVLDPPPNGGRPSLEQVRKQVRERIDETSLLRRRLSMPGVGQLSLPVWLPDPAFDVGQLVRPASLPEPGGEAELMAWLGDYFSQRLDRDRPLWETTLLEGLEGGRWALVCKVHHCLVDGISGMTLVAALLDTEPEPDPEETAKKLAAMVTWFSEEAKRGALMGLRGVVGEAAGGIDAAVHPHKVMGILAQSRAMAETLAHDELAAPPHTSLNEPIGAGRRLAAVEVPLAEMKRVKQELGGTVEDVTLALTAAGLRRLFEHRGETVEQVRVLLPVSLHQASEALVRGDSVCSLFADLPVSEPDPLLRYRKVVAATEELKSDDDAVGTAGGIDLADLAPSLLQSVVARLAFTPGLFNVTLTNLSISPIPLYSLTAPVQGVVPMVPISTGYALAVTVVIYNDGVYFGLNADRDSMPDLEVMQHGIEDALAELQTVSPAI